MIKPVNKVQIQKKFFEHDSKIQQQHQDKQPGLRGIMQPKPDCGEERYLGSGKLTDQTAIISTVESVVRPQSRSPGKVPMW